MKTYVVALIRTVSSLELSRQEGSNDGSQNMFLWNTEKLTKFYAIDPFILEKIFKGYFCVHWEHDCQKVKVNQYSVSEKYIQSCIGL